MEFAMNRGSIKGMKGDKENGASPFPPLSISFFL